MNQIFMTWTFSHWFACPQGIFFKHSTQIVRQMFRFYAISPILYPQTNFDYCRFFFREKYKDPRYSAERSRPPDITLADPLGVADPTLRTTPVRYNIFLPVFLSVGLSAKLYKYKTMPHQKYTMNQTNVSIILRIHFGLSIYTKKIEFIIHNGNIAIIK